MNPHIQVITTTKNKTDAKKIGDFSRAETGSMRSDYRSHLECLLVEGKNGKGGRMALFEKTTRTLAAR